MGQELQTNRGRALRSSLAIKPGPNVLERPEFQLPHRRGEILVAATLAALVRAWARRLEDLGAETIRGADPRAIRRIAEEGAAGSAYLLTLAIRALDYAPPIDLLFGDFLSAMLTADAEVSPQERRFKYRQELLESFGEYGIAPASDAAEGLWQPPDADPHIEDKRPL